MRSGAEVCLLPRDFIRRIFLNMDVFSAFQLKRNYTELYACIPISQIYQLFGVVQTETPSTHCCCALYAGTIKQLHQGCHLESAFPRPPLSQWLMKLCLGSLEITGKMWISELFNLVAKFSPVLHLTKTNLSRTVRVATSNKGHRIEGHQIYKQMENNFLKWCLPEESQG